MQNRQGFRHGRSPSGPRVARYVRVGQMSDLGHSRDLERAPATSGLPSTADISHKAGGLCGPDERAKRKQPPGPLVSTIDSRWSLCPPRREELRPRALRRYWSRHPRVQGCSSSTSANRFPLRLGQVDPILAKLRWSLGKPESPLSAFFG